MQEKTLALFSRQTGNVSQPKKRGGASHQKDEQGCYYFDPSDGIAVGACGALVHSMNREQCSIHVCQFW